MQLDMITKNYYNIVLKMTFKKNNKKNNKKIILFIILYIYVISLKKIY